MVKLKHVLQQVISDHWQNGKWWIMVSARVFDQIYLFRLRVYQKRRRQLDGEDQDRLLMN